MRDKKEDTLKQIEDFLEKNDTSINTSLQELLKDYKRKSKRLDKIIKQSDRQQLQMMHLNEELNDYKNNLEEKVKQEIEKRKEKERMLFQQAKLASMGEMMDAIAHQWKQPLNVISAQVVNLMFQYHLDMLDEKHIESFEKDITRQITHMTDTLNEFRSFFRPSVNLADFDVNSMIEKVLFLVKDEFIKNNIEIIVDDVDNFSIKGIENEFKHLIINVINNAKDAFVENNIQERKIIIKILKLDDRRRIEIIDNAGGIPEDIIEDIFKADVTTKEEGKGTGIGLYMSSQIAQKHNGILSVENVKDGAKFIFELKKEF